MKPSKTRDQHTEQQFSWPRPHPEGTRISHSAQPRHTQRQTPRIHKTTITATIDAPFATSHPPSYSLRSLVSLDEAGFQKRWRRRALPAAERRLRAHRGARDPSRQRLRFGIFATNILSLGSPSRANPPGLIACISPGREAYWLRALTLATGWGSRRFRPARAFPDPPSGPG